MHAWRFAVRWLRVADDLLEIVGVAALRAVAFPFRRKRWLVLVTALATFAVGVRLGERIVGRDVFTRGLRHYVVRKVTLSSIAPTPETLTLPAAPGQGVDPACALFPYVGRLTELPAADAALLRSLRYDSRDDGTARAVRERVVERWAPIVSQFVTTVLQFHGQQPTGPGARGYPFRIDPFAVEPVYQDFLTICMEDLELRIERRDLPGAISIFEAWLELCAFVESSAGCGRTVVDLDLVSCLRWEFFDRASGALLGAPLDASQRQRLIETLERTCPSLEVLQRNLWTMVGLAASQYGELLASRAGKPLGLFPYFGKASMPADRRARGLWLELARDKLVEAGARAWRDLDRARLYGVSVSCDPPGLGVPGFLAKVWGGLRCAFSSEALATRTAVSLAGRFEFGVRRMANLMIADAERYRQAIEALRGPHDR